MIRALLSKDRASKSLTVVLYVQAGMAVFVGLGSVVGMSGFAHTVVDGRRLAVGFWAFAVMLVAIVIPKFSEYRWLLIVPLAWTVFHLADSLFELLVMGDALFITPVIVETAFLIAYSTLFRVLSGRQD